jgi:hypothetical protein
LVLHWDKVVAISKSNIASQDCPEPPLYRGQPIHDKLYKALHALNGHYSRIQPWFPHPKLAVAELRPPDKSQTYWDLNLMDDMVERVMNATAGHPFVFQAGTIPSWMLTTPTPNRYPQAPQAIDWTYSRDGKLGPSSAELLAEYQAGMAGWYIRGGFKESWAFGTLRDMLTTSNTVSRLMRADQRFSPQDLTALYDACVHPSGRSLPMKFMGPTLSDTAILRQFVAYFFDPKNHHAEIPVDIVPITSTLFRIGRDPGNHAVHKSAVVYIEAIRKVSCRRQKPISPNLGSILVPAEAVKRSLFPFLSGTCRARLGVCLWTFGGETYRHHHPCRVDRLSRPVCQHNACQLGNR